MKHSLWFVALCVALSACAIKRPLIPPSEIPAYEKRLEDKRKEREDFLREQQQRERELQEIQQQQPTPPQQAI